MAVSRREDTVVFFVEAVLLVDFEEGFKAFLVAGSALVLAFVVVPLVLEVVFAGLAATLGSFFVVVFLVVPLDSLVVLSFLVEDLLVEAVLVTVVVDLDLDLAGAFLEVVGLDTFVGLFCSRY